MPQQDLACWRGDISISHNQWSTELLLKCLEPKRHRTTSDTQQLGGTSEMPRLHNGGKRLQLLSIKIHDQILRARYARSITESATVFCGSSTARRLANAVRTDS
ncbi:hypothetical protein DR64_3908 [Paraburkholderia xenovorans LB400]|nr:hypothetical protein DR64_3908 [Paraburkholderia xenovorans LB400]